MPGIAGVISRSGARTDEVAVMTQLLVHQPSYVTGNQSFDELGVAVGWAAHARSFAADAPIWNQRRDVCLVFTGEVFADATPNHANRLLSLYEEFGLAFLSKLNGWFSGLLIDLRLKTAVLFNDRYGLGRLYFHADSDHFYFASEAKCLLAVLPRLRQLDLRSVGESIAVGCALQNRTLFTDVSLLPGGAQWVFDATGRVAKESYFNRRDWEEQGELGPEDFYAQLQQTFHRILARYIQGPGSVAMSLTGGLDGRMIMACLDLKPGALPCYSFGGPYRDCADVTLARKLAARCGQTHQTIKMEEDFFRDFPKLAEDTVFISDGAMDVTGAVELYVNRLAREIAPIRLTGNYGSEIVRGNVAFRPGKFSRTLLDAEFAKAIQTAAETYSTERNVTPLSFIAFKQTPWHHYARLSIEQSQLTLRSPYLDNDLVALMYRAPASLRTSKELSLRLIHDGNTRLAELPTDRGEIYGDDSAISKLRQQLIDLTVKAEYAFDYGMPQRLARVDHMLMPLHLERLFLGWHKFYHFRVWYRDRFAAYLKEILLDPRSLQRGYLRSDAVEKMIKAHVEGAQNWTLEIHRLLTLELLQRRLIDR